MNKKYLLSVILTFILIFIYTTTAFAEKLPVPNLNAQSAIMIDMKTGKVIYDKNPNEKLFPASTTKILTAIIALENCEDLSTFVTASHAAIDPITLEDSHMGILVGEQLTLEQLVYGMLVYSANDAANVLAVHVAGSIDAFAQMMNEKAKSIGAVNSHFVNPHGFHDDEHFTTASDLAKIARYAMTNEKFREIVKTARYTIEPTNKYTETRYLTSTNHLISKYRVATHYYAPAIGIKTGYTSKAGNCLVAAAEKDNTQLLTVVLKCTNSANEGTFVDTKALFEYGFSNYKYINVASSGEVVADSPVYVAKNDARVAITVQDNVSALLPVDIDVKTNVTADIQLNEKIQAPIAVGDSLGTVSYSYNGEILGQTALVAVNSVDRNTLAWIFLGTLNVIKNPFFIGGVILVAIAALYIRNKRNSNRRRRRSYINKYR